MFVLWIWVDVVNYAISLLTMFPVTVPIPESPLELPGMASGLIL